MFMLVIYEFWLDNYRLHETIQSSTQKKYMYYSSVIRPMSPQSLSLSHSLHNLLGCRDQSWHTATGRHDMIQS